MNGEVWISPCGGLGDTLMLSGVLKHVIDRNHSKQFNLVTRTKYPPILSGHPAIKKIGHPPKDAVFIHSDYWNTPEYKLEHWRAYQALAYRFGLDTPIEEILYVPWELIENDPVLMARLPSGKIRIAISPSSDSPRKQWPLSNWEKISDMLNREGAVVVQFGKRSDSYIRGAYSFLGITSPRQAIMLLRHFDVFLGQDSLFMHAAHLHNIPAVVMWGGTDSKVYGYDGQLHLSALRHCSYPQGCLGCLPYEDHCPYPDIFCMDGIKVDEVFECIRSLINL
ncbi:MAG: glycosyltransferase family 9 protein [Deltaproteobacteria bacterium]|jgi:ADP-heptose:LPS heptosyltransferase